jgi:hypothetical protein
MGTAIRRGLSGASLVMALFCGGCTGSGNGEDTAPTGADSTAGDSVCAECPVQAGGESSDFGGTPHTCTHFELRAPIDRSRASDLGFDVDALEQRIERPLDAPLHWKPEDSRAGGPASGYQPETWIEGTAKLSGWYTYVGLDPARCEGTECADTEVGEWTCSDRLELGIEAQFRTLDGAVNAFASGYVLLGRPGASFGETPGSSLRANLRDVHGSLRVVPDQGLAIVEALLMMDLYFKADRTEGDLRPFLVLRDSPATVVHYLPLSGHWPGPLPEPQDPAMGGPEP